MTPKFLYPYAVRRSTRARNVRLVVSAEGLTVVVPQKFCVSRDLPPILEEKRDWIAKALADVMKRTQHKKATQGVPEAIELRALGETWRVAFAPLTRDRLSAENGTLTLASDFNESEALAALRHWLRLKGREHLPLLLEEEARRHRFSYVKVTVKEQKKPLGELFLQRQRQPQQPAQEMNHSKAFHRLLAQLDFNAEKNAAELKQAWNFVPGWVL